MMFLGISSVAKSHLGKKNAMDEPNRASNKLRQKENCARTTCQPEKKRWWCQLFAKLRAI